MVFTFFVPCVINRKKNTMSFSPIKEFFSLFLEVIVNFSVNRFYFGNWVLLEILVLHKTVHELLKKRMFLAKTNFLTYWLRTTRDTEDGTLH